MAPLLAAISLSTVTGWGQTSTRLEGSRPAAEIVGDTGAPYENLFRPTRIGGEAARPKVGPGRGSIDLPLLRAPTYNIPFIERGFRPEEAELKLGQLYLDLREASASVLHSDNVNLAAATRESGTIGILRLSTALMFQVNDGLRLAVQGALIYLPFRGKAGINGFGISDPLEAEFGAQPLAHAQVAYDFVLGGWDFTVQDDFTVNTPNYQADLTIDQQFGGAEFEEADTAGRYTYRDTGGVSRRGETGTRSSRLTEQDLIYRNTVTVMASRMIPTVTRASFILQHDNYWYEGGVVGTITRRDSVTLSLDNEKKDLRFKPFVYYTASNDDSHPGWDHQARAGFRGPVTENLDFLGDSGYYWQTGGGDQNTFLWRIRFDHTPGPLTWHFVEFGRTVTRPERDLDEYMIYNFFRRLGPYMTGELFGERHRFEDLDNNNSGSTEYRAGARLGYDLGRRADILFTAYYRRVEHDAAGTGGFDAFTGRVQYEHRLGETLQAEFTYQYEKQDSTISANSYYENLFILTLRKYF